MTEKLSVTEWAIREQGYDPDVLPWQSEIMDCLGESGTAEVGLIKPVQCGATFIGLAWTGWIIDSDPDDMLI
jgi:phage terminase large subunit GpA-like protein